MRVMLIDDHALFRRGLRLMLRELMPEADVSEADSCAAAIDMADSAFDLVLLDLNMPGMQGLSALDAIKPVFKQCPVVVVSGEDSPTLIRTAIQDGAAGFIPKTSEPEVMQAALRVVLARGVYVPADALGAQTGSLESLTPRQLEVLRRALKGTPNKLIARELNISEGTVKSHLSATFRAINARNRTEALYFAAHSGFKL